MPRRLEDALRIAAKDLQFAQDFVANPEDYQKLYSLSDRQIAEIKATKVGDALARLPGGGGVGPVAADYY